MTGSSGPAAEVVARRREARRRLLQRAEAFAHALDPELGVRAVVVFGSVARGDFTTHSDVDVLVVADRLPEDYRSRLDVLGWPPPVPVEPVAWTPTEYRRQRERRNPIAVEAENVGVWLVGGARALHADPSPVSAPGGAGGPGPPAGTPGAPHR